MASTSWFKFNGRWHALTAHGHRGECGIEPLTMPETVTPEDPFEVPPDHCPRCLVEVGKGWVEEEPLDVAKARGFYEEPLPESDEALQASKQTSSQA